MFNKASAAVLGTIIGAVLLVTLFQNCARVGLRSTEKGLGNNVFGCTETTKTCEKDGKQGTMICTPGPSGPEWGDCEVPNDPNPPTPMASCTFKGVTYTHGQSFVAYEYASVAASASCRSELRTCINGALTGNYQFLTCINDSGECNLGGVTVQHNQTIEAFQASSVPYGETCKKQVRRCYNGALDGSYNFLTCVTDGAGTCTFNNQVIPHLGQVVAYEASTVPYGGSCKSENRACNNGVLSGTYSAASCIVTPAGSCKFDGKDVLHGTSVTAYESSTVPFGGTCKSQQRTCTNGVLSGTYTAASCAPTPAANCTFSGQTVAHNSSVAAYETATVPFGQTCKFQQRLCNNGSLSGTYANANCSVQNAQTCTFNGQTIAHNSTVTGYQASSVAFGQTCVSEVRTCSNGALSGSYSAGSCSVAPPATCSFNGQTVAHDAAVTAYQASSVTFGNTCVSQVRTCSNGTLSGSYTSPACTVAPPVNCTFNGQTIAHNATVTTYGSPSVAFGQTCESVSEIRKCVNGTLSGNSEYASCTVRAPATCTFNGQTVAHGASVNAFFAAQVTSPDTCPSQTRTCNNGSLSGSYAYPSCSVYVPPMAQCNVYYQARNDSKVSSTVSNGTWALFHSDANKDCNDYPGCGIRLGVSCTGEAQIRLAYQFKSFSTASVEKVTPWSGVSGAVQWGDWSLVYNPSHPEAECKTPYQCGIRIAIETQNGQQCSVSYSYKVDKSNYSPAAANGAWSVLSRGSGQGDNCDDDNCGMRAVLSCQAPAAYTPPGGGGGGGGGRIERNHNQMVSSEKMSSDRIPASADQAETELSLWTRISNWFSALWASIFG